MCGPLLQLLDYGLHPKYHFENDVTRHQSALIPRLQASVWKPTCRHGKDYQAVVPARQPRPAGACDDPRMGVRGPDEAAAKLLARTVEKAAADALPPDAVQVCGAH